MAEEFDPFEQGSGLLDDIDVAFKDCSFGTRSDYNDGKSLLFIVDALVDGDDGPEEQELIFSCGNGWESGEKGAIAKREDSSKKPIFQKTCAYAMLTSKAVELGAPLKERSEDSGTDDEGRTYGPRRASIWNGLIFHMKRQKVSYGGEIGDKERLLPSEYKGEVGEVAKKASGTAKKATGAAKKATPPSKGDADDNGAAPLTAKAKVALRKLAKELAENDGSHDDFVEAALELPEVDEDNEQHVDAISDDGEDSIWGKAVAEV